MNTFFIEGKDGRIEVAHDNIKDANTEKVAIICHPHPLYQGTMHNKVVTTIARAMKGCGIESYRFNYRGVGDSQGEYGEGLGELEDLISVYNWVKMNTAAKEIILCGFSFGGAIAYMGTAKLDMLSSLITIAPAVDRFDLSKCPKPTIPWLVVQGTDDDTVNPQSVFDFIADKNDTNLTLIKKDEVGHFFHGKLTALKEVIENFVKPLI